MKNYQVYIHTNKINNKKYIGITCQRPEDRWANGLGYKGQPLFWNAIVKYGWDNFDHYVLPENFTEAEAKDMEIKLIAKYHTCVLDENCRGYNITRGGEGCRKYLTEEERHHAYVASYKKANKKKYELVKNDNDQYNALLEYNRQNKRNKLADPVKHEKLNLYNKLDMRERRKDPEYAEKQRAAHRLTSKKVTALRQLLLANTNKLSEEDFTYITERAKTGYKHQSLKKLQQLAEKYEITQKT